MEKTSDDGRRTIEILSSHRSTSCIGEHSNGSADVPCRCSWNIFDFDSDQAEIPAKHVPEMVVDLIEMLDRYFHQFTLKRFSLSVWKCC